MATTAERLHEEWTTPHTLYGELATVDHKKIGKRYLATAFIFLLLGGIGGGAHARAARGPNQHLLSPEMYDQLFTMHGTTMIFLVRGADAVRASATTSGRS